MMARSRNRRGKPAAEVDFADRQQAEQWFRGQPREVSVTLPARAALRVLPLLTRARDRPEFAARIVLPAFRACLLAWSAAEYPGHRNRLRSAARHAAAAAYAAADAAYAAADAAYAAAYAAADAADAAADAAYAAAYAADAAAYAAYAAAVHADAQAIETGQTPVALTVAPLWAGVDAQPEPIAVAWTELQMGMLAWGDDWPVWVRWYYDRRDGKPSLGEAFDLAVATLPDELWEQGPAAVNARIKELIAEHTPPAPIPAQGPGPHFALNRDPKVALAPPEEFDPDGNNLRRIREQLPLVRQAAGDLAGHLNPNTQPEISRNLNDYRAAIAGKPDTIAWGTVFGLGVRLENAASAARRDIADRLQEPLEDAAQEALDSVLTLHGPLVLATREGRELAEEADRFRLSRDEREALQRDAERVSQNLRNAPEIAEPDVIRVAEQAAETTGEGPHPERGAAYWLATAKNLTTILVPAAGLGALAWTIGGVGENATLLTGALLFHENQRLRDAARALGVEYHRLADAALDTGQNQAALARAQAIERLRRLTPFRDFVTANEEPLRRIAGYSTSLRWMLWYIDFIVRTNAAPTVTALQYDRVERKPDDL
jgi:hypothetical protein